MRQNSNQGQPKFTIFSSGTSQLELLLEKNLKKRAIFSINKVLEQQFVHKTTVMKSYVCFFKLKLLKIYQIKKTDLQNTGNSLNLLTFCP